MIRLFSRRSPIERLDPTELRTTRIALQQEQRNSLEKVNRLSTQLLDLSKQVLNAPSKMQKMALMPMMNSTLVQMKLEGMTLRGISAQLNIVLMAEAIKSYQDRATQIPIIKRLLKLPPHELGQEMARILAQMERLDQQSAEVVSSLTGMMETSLPRELEEFLRISEDAEVQAALKEDPDKAAQIVSQKVMRAQGLEA